MGPLCGFFATPTAAQRRRLRLADPDTVIGCGQDASGGPLFFFVPVVGGAVRVPVCPKHAALLKRHHSPDTAPAAPAGAGEAAYTPGIEHTHRHFTDGLGRVEHNHLGGGGPHGHDPDTGFQIPLTTRHLHDAQAPLGGGGRWECRRCGHPLQRANERRPWESAINGSTECQP